MTEEKRIEIPILYRKGGILLCRKPVGILSQGGTAEDMALLQVILLLREMQMLLL